MAVVPFDLPTQMTMNVYKGIVYHNKSFHAIMHFKGEFKSITKYLCANSLICIGISNDLLVLHK